MPASSAPRSGLRRLLYPESWPPMAGAAVLLLASILVAYAEAWKSPFLAGDLGAVAGNESVRAAWPDWTPPVAAWLFAGFDRVAGLNPLAHHALGLLLHLAASLGLFGVVRLTLRRIRRGEDGFLPPLAIALVWALHPLASEPVIHISHRGVLLGGALVLAALYAAARALEPGAGRAWRIAAIAAGGLGMAVHPVALALPLVVLCWDRAFAAGSLYAAWREHRTLHAGLMLIWGIGVAALVVPYVLLAGMPARGDGIRAITTFLTLAFRPWPLVFDYGAAVAPPTAGDVALVLGLVALTVVALVRFPRIAVPLLALVLTLAAELAFVGPGMEVVSEHRMYMPLAGLVATVAGAVVAVAGSRAAWGVAALAVVLGGSTRTRSLNYASALDLWGDTVAKAPANPRAHFELGNALAGAGRPADAATRFETALRLAPEDERARFNLAGALLQSGRADQAVSHYETLLRDGSGPAAVHLNLASALVRLGRMDEAVGHYEAAMQRGVVPADERRYYGRALAEVGRIDEALEQLAASVQLDPSNAGSRVIYGMVLSAAGQAQEGVRQFVQAVQLAPDDPDARMALGDALVDLFRPAEALVHYEAAMRIDPGRAAVLHTSMGHAYARLGRVDEAIAHYESALRLNPDDVEAQANLEMVRSAVRRHLQKREAR